MSRPAQSERRRKWSPKVRSGCNTCKIRRKKCDETKPRCLRCIKGKYTCDGYNPPDTWLFSPSEKTQSSKPSTSSALPLVSPLTLSEADEEDTKCSTLPKAHSDTVEMIIKSDGWLIEPSSWLSMEFDRNYARYFQFKLVPLLSTTKQWSTFWSRVVPQASWHNQALHHAMIALAATYESLLSGIDRSNEILRKSNLAIKAFTRQPACPDTALIMCRLFSSMAQCTGDWKTAYIHIDSGGRILKETTRGTKANPEIARLMAPTFLCVTLDKTGDSDALERIPWTKQPLFAELETIRSEYGRVLYVLMDHPHWRKLRGTHRSLMSVSWSIMIQTICSVIYPDMVVFTADDPIVPATQVRTELLEAGARLSLDELKTTSRQLFRDLQVFFKRGGSDSIFCSDIKPRLQRFVENFVVQAADIEPRMTAGTFWHEEGEGGCAIERHLAMVQPCTDPQGRVWGSDSGSCSGSHSPSSPVPMGDLSCEKRGYFLEHVCHYRSGFWPAFMTSLDRVDYSG